MTCYVHSRGRVFEAVGGAIMAGLDVCIRISCAAYSMCLTERGMEGCQPGQTGRKIDVCARGEKHK